MWSTKVAAAISLSARALITCACKCLGYSAECWMLRSTLCVYISLNSRPQGRPHYHTLRYGIHDITVALSGKEKQCSWGHHSPLCLPIPHLPAPCLSQCLTAREVFDLEEFPCGLDGGQPRLGQGTRWTYPVHGEIEQEKLPVTHDGAKRPCAPRFITSRLCAIFTFAPFLPPSCPLLPLLRRSV